MPIVVVTYKISVYVRPGEDYKPLRDSHLLQATTEVARLIGEISKCVQDNSDGELEQRQRDLLSLLQKIFREGKYLEIRETMKEMFQRIRKNDHFAFLDIVPELNKIR